jgi:hypothetical protein
VFGSSGGGRSSYNANSNNYNNSNNEVGGGGGGGGGEMAGTKAGMPYIGTIRIGTAGTTSQMQPIGLNQITALPPRPLFGGGGGGGPPPPHSSSSTGPTGVGGGFCFDLIFRIKECGNLFLKLYSL